MTLIVANFVNIQRQIAAACQGCGRNPSSVNLIAVSKSQDSDQIATLFAAGQQSFGENYLDEALPKIAALVLRIGISSGRLHLLLQAIAHNYLLLKIPLH